MRRVLVLVLLVICGCGRGSFVGQRMDNFTAYYNTFYNAEKALELGIETMLDGLERQEIDQDTYLSLFGRSNTRTTQRKPFEDAIKKSSDVLREHPDSKWVDDAMMVIGQAWFFTQNYVGAEEKFNEILAIESPLHDEARFWLARTLIASTQYDEAFNFLQATLNGDDVAARWEPYLRLALADLHVQRENWEQAAQELEAGLESVDDRYLAGRAEFFLGQIYETLERYDNAIQAYDRVQDYQPFYELSYAAQYSVVRVLADYRDPVEALYRLRRMERDDKNYDHRGKLAYLRGRVLLALGYDDDALDIFDELLYDPLANGAEIRGSVHYALGEYYRDVVIDFPYAAAHFDTARQSLSAGRTVFRQGGSETPIYAPAAITDGEEQARVFLSYADAMDRIALLDSLLYLGSLDDSTYNALVLGLRQQRAEELEKQRRESEKNRAEAQFRNNPGADFDSNFGRTPEGKDLQGGATDTGNDAGFLFHRDNVRMQQAQADFALLWGDRPLAPNWRRRDAVRAFVEDGYEEEGFLEDAENPEAVLPEVDMSAVPRDEESRQRALESRAAARYALANVLFLSMHRPDSAAAWYRMVIEEDEDSDVAPRAYYALGEVQRSLGDTLSAERIYRTIIDRYPTSDFSGRVFEQLGIEPTSQPAPDSLTRAEAAYDAALGSWRDGAYAASLDDMVQLAITYPTTQVAPRALLAAGSVYTEWAVRDSLDLLGDLPLSVPDSVLYASEIFNTSQRTTPTIRNRPVQSERLEKGENPEQVAEGKEATTPEPLRLETLYRRLSETYPTTPQATMANESRSALTEIINTRAAEARRLAAIADSLAAADSLAIADSLVAADSLAIADSLGKVLPEAGAVDSLGQAASDSLVMTDSLVGVETDSLAMAEETFEASANAAAQHAALPPAGDPSAPDPGGEEEQLRLPGLGLIDWTLGGYTVFVRTETRHENAIGFANNFGRTLPDLIHPIDVYAAEVKDGIEFRIGIGLFQTVPQAESVLEAYRDQLPSDARVQRIPSTRQ